MKNLNHYVAIYKEQLEKGDILIAYNHLVKFVMQLRTDFKKNLAEHYSFSGILHGYMDYTYFYYSNEFLKSKKLKLGLVLNHLDIQFEVWLLGNTISVQQAYWEKLKESAWNKDRHDMPQYSILEAVIVPHPDFDDLPQLTTQIKERMLKESQAIIDVLRSQE